MNGEGERLKDYGVWLALLGLAWVLQLVLSMRQMRRFYRRVNELKRLGRSSIGVGGGTYRGRAYAVVVADPQGRVLAEAPDATTRRPQLLETSIVGVLEGGFCASPFRQSRELVAGAISEAHGRATPIP